MMVQTEQERCIVIFNVHFVDKDDQLLGKVFIEEFVHGACVEPSLIRVLSLLNVFLVLFLFLMPARKGLPAAPSVSFSLVEPPRELEGVPGVKVGFLVCCFGMFVVSLTWDFVLFVKAGDQQGFVSFVLHPAHMAKRANTISHIQIFRNYLHYHIKV